MAASNDRMVSSGRSARDRVGFDQSGSATTRTQGLVEDTVDVGKWRFGMLETMWLKIRKRVIVDGNTLTDHIAILIFMLDISKRA